MYTLRTYFFCARKFPRRCRTYTSHVYMRCANLSPAHPLQSKSPLILFFMKTFKLDIFHPFSIRTKKSDRNFIDFLQHMAKVAFLSKTPNNGNQVDALICTIFFFKGFDRVPHKILLYKLSHYGINGNILTWTEMFLTQRSESNLGEDCIKPMWCDLWCPTGYCNGSAAFSFVH